MRDTAGEGMIDNKTRKAIEGFMRIYPCKDSAVLPSLEMVRKQNGHVSERDMEDLARILNFPEARIFSVASFYSMLNLKPRGKHHIQVCTNVACSLLQADSLFEYISNKLGIRDGQTTDDGLFSLEPVECIASCGSAPAIMINEDRYENIDCENIDALIRSFREKEGSLI